MHVVVDIPDQKPGTLDASLARQFAEIQRQLMGLMKDQDTSSLALHQMFLDALEEQQSTLVKALEHLMGPSRVSKTAASLKVSVPSELLTRLDSLETAMVEAMRKSRSRTFGSNY